MKTSTLFALASLASAPTSILLAPAPAAAADDDSLAVGFRIGGWGFREPGADAVDNWKDCRMDGLGVYAERAVWRRLFVEVGADVYFSSDTFGIGDDGHDHDHAHGGGDMASMDRLSGLLTAGVGVRTPTSSWLSGYVMGGAGVEATRVKMGGLEPYTGHKTMPLGFVGFGGDLRLTDSLRIGASYRALLMGHFDHHTPTPTMDTEAEVASQGQFHLRMSM